ncbi:MAG: GmrSD restriction endonuclease domain-containing protein, partial [Acidimicrobiales bacterium]
MPFDSPDLMLGDLLREVGQGKVQLPDFQREWKWDDPHISSLLASVSLGHPVGVVMTLETGGAGVQFAPKPLAGVPLPAASPPQQL